MRTFSMQRVSARLATASAVVGLVVVTAACGGGGGDSSSAGGSSSSAPHAEAQTTGPGFDGKTIKVSGLADVAYFGDSAIGAQARFKRANDTDELKGVTIEFGELGDSKFEASTAIGEVRRVVEQEGAFAVVPMIASSGISNYLNQKKIPFFGWGTSAEYCGEGDDLYGFGFSGCVLPPDPTEVPDFAAGTVYKFMTETLGLERPTIAGIGTDNAPGATGIKSFIAQATGSGLKVVWAKNNLPAPPAVVGDYSPYAQQVLRSNGGKGPDALWIAGGVADALGLPKALRNAGYKGIIVSAYYSDALLKPLADTYVLSSFAPFEQHTAGIDQLVADVKAFKADASPTVTLAAGYFGADFFIEAVKKAGTKRLTRESLREAAANMTWEIEGSAGPTEYPRAFQAHNDYCSALVYGDGTSYELAVPFQCTKHFTAVKKGVDEIG